MFIDYTSPPYKKGDIVKLKRKRLPFKIIDIFEQDDGTYLYRCQTWQEYLVKDDQIEYTIQSKT
jgi:hypothetical protein